MRKLHKLSIAFLMGLCLLIAYNCCWKKEGLVQSDKHGGFYVGQEYKDVLEVINGKSIWGKYSVIGEAIKTSELAGKMTWYTSGEMSMSLKKEEMDTGIYLSRHRYPYPTIPLNGRLLILVGHRIPLMYIYINKHGFVCKIYTFST